MKKHIFLGFLFFCFTLQSFSQGTIIGNIYKDVDEDGYISFIDQGINGVTIHLYTSTNNPVAAYETTSQMFTMYDGEFVFGVPYGTYYMIIYGPTGYYFNNTGNNEGFTIYGATPPQTAVTGLFTVDGTNPMVSLYGGMRTTPPAPIVTAPTIQASNVTFSNIGYQNVTVNWARGNGAGVLVIAKQGGPVDAVPVDGQFYFANTDFSSGTDLGNGNYVKYIGSGTSESIFSMLIETEYHFAVYEFNGTAADPVFLLSNPARGSFSTTASTSPVPGNAMSFNGTNSFMSTFCPSLQYGYMHKTGVFTIELWLKINNPDEDKLQTIIANTNSASDIGLYFGYDNRSSQGRNHQLTLSIFNGSGTAAINSISPVGVITDSEWHHIAVTGNGASITYYIDDNAFSGTGTIGLLSAADQTRYYHFGACPIGYQPACNNYTGNVDFLGGVIDELRFWHSERTLAQIRGNRHLISVGNETDLFVYFQMNESSGSAQSYVKYANFSASLMGGATRIISDIAVARGTSFSLNVFSGGVYNFTGTDMSLTFPGAGTYPNGELVVSRLNGNPVDLPSGSPRFSQFYWVVNNYGSNQTFSPLTQLTIINFGTISIAEAADPSNNFRLYKRPSNAVGTASWVNFGAANAANSGSQSVSFNSSVNISSFSQIIVGGGATLPVTLVNFSGRTLDSGNELYWKTAEEIDFSHFKLEGSRDGNIFEEVAVVVAEGSNSDYAYVDNSESSYTYYRLKIVDLDGSYSYSPIVHIYSLDDFKMKIFPSPFVKGDQVKLQISSSKEETGTCVIYDLEGKELISRVIHIQPGQSVFFIPAEKLPSGVLILKVITETRVIADKLKGY